MCWTLVDGSDTKSGSVSRGLSPKEVALIPIIAQTGWSNQTPRIGGTLTQRMAIHCGMGKTLVDDSDNRSISVFTGGLRP